MSLQPAGGRGMGLAMRFRVVVDKLGDLGEWGSCKGLAVDFAHIQVKEGADYDGVRFLPDRITYHPVVLTRALSSSGHPGVMRWLGEVARGWYGDPAGGTKFLPMNATITLFDARAEQVASWTLRSVYPKSWRAPDFDAAGSAVAVETLELVHEGFL